MKYCIICGAELPEKRSNNRKYCSTACARKAEATQRIEYITNRASHRNRVAHLVYKAYGCKCAICQWQASPNLISVKGHLQYSHGNEIHHIIPAREGGTEEASNLILLCPNHHKQADLGILDRETLKKYTKPIDVQPPEEEVQRARAKCADTITRAIF